VRYASFEMDMKREIPNTTGLDRLTSSLLNSTALRHDEIEQIAVRDDLFRSVKRRIANEAREERRVYTGGALFTRPRVLVLGSVISVLTIAFTVAGIVSRTKVTIKAPPPSVARSTAQPEPQQPEPAKDEHPQQRSNSDYVMVGTRPSVERQSAAVKTAYHPAKNSEVSEPEQQQPIEFYALADMSSNESVAGGRVVRVDLPRASLVALGINVPLGSDKQLIKADIVVGPDGVPRAIRVVE